MPIAAHYARVFKAYCRPTMFSYQHVVITGCGTGLGRSLVQKIFTRGAVITMIGKDKAKLKQLRDELDPGLSTIPLINVITCDISQLDTR
jgi:short-subunit dehydrogenase